MYSCVVRDLMLVSHLVLLLTSVVTGITILALIRFYLCKENKDTQDALGVIGKMLGLQVYLGCYFFL
jgi:multisubunit Na+/H+ antiporter MnhG subunit